MGSVASDGLRSIRSQVPDSLYLGSPYAEVHTFLCVPVSAPRNVKVLISPAGLGKTALLQNAFAELGAQVRVAWVPAANRDALALVGEALNAIGSREGAPHDLVSARQQLQALVNSAPPTVREFILAVDDAHQLSAASLEAFGTLLDVEGPRNQPVALILAGRPELQYRLADPRMKKIRERIAGVMTLEPLNAQEKDEYIRHRRGSAGDPLSVEMSAAVDRTEGYPRLLDQLLLSAYPAESAKRTVLRFSRPPLRPLESAPSSDDATVTAPEPAELPEISTEALQSESRSVARVKPPRPRSRWEQLGWPAIFAIAACLLLPLVSTMVYLMRPSHKAQSATTDASGVANSAPLPPPSAAVSPSPAPSNGAGVTASEHALTIESLRVPAQVGDPEAQYKLGLQLAGSHNTADVVYGYAWLVMARAGGQPVDNDRLRAIAQKLKPKDILDVRYRLGSMYEKGIGCQADAVTADTWYQLAASAGDARSRSASIKIEKTMTAPQREDAHQRAAEWTRSHTPSRP